MAALSRNELDRPNKRPKPLQARTVQLLRRLTQVSVVAFIGYIAVRSALVGESAEVAATSAEAYCAFGGIEGLYRFITSGGQTLAKTHLSNLVILAAAVLATFFARGFFCGWLCPLGSIQEWLGRLGRRLWPKRYNRMVPQRVDRILKWLRYLVLLAIIVATIATGKLIFQAYDPWAALIKFSELGLGVGGIVLALVLVGSLFVERPWCRWLCPLGAVLGLVGKLSPFRVRRQPAVCTSCKLCTRKCPLGIAVHEHESVNDASCIGCLECVSACPATSALTVGLSSRKSAPEKPESTKQRARRQQLAFVLVGLVVFFGAIGGAKALGSWSTSGRVDGEGNAIVATSDPESVKGWMTVDDVCQAFAITPEQLYGQFGVPAGTPVTTQLKDLETVAPGFELTVLRTWLTTLK